MYTTEQVTQVENDYNTDNLILQGEKEQGYQTLLQSLTKSVRRISRKEAKGKYLYKRLDGQMRLV